MAIQREVDVLNSRFLAQEIVDVYRFDTVSVVAGASKVQFFQSLSAKDNHQANFEGDKALVKEGRLFEVRFIIARVVHHESTLADRDHLEEQGFFEQGSWKWDVANVRFDEDSLYQISGGSQYRPVQKVDGGSTTSSTIGYYGDGRHDNVRMYAIEKVVPGGREVDFEVSWEATGGSPNTVPFNLQIRIYGIELVPLQEIGRAA